MLKLTFCVCVGGGGGGGYPKLEIGWSLLFEHSMKTLIDITQDCLICHSEPCLSKCQKRVWGWGWGGGGGFYMLELSSVPGFQREACQFSGV